MALEYDKPLPLPANSKLTQPYWDGAKRHELMMQRCLKCAQIFFYPREVCPECLSPELEWTKLSGRGRLHSYTVVHQPANKGFMEDVPYIFAMIQLNEGPKMVSNLVEIDSSEVEVDMMVEAVFDDVTEEITLIKFKPA